MTTAKTVIDTGKSQIGVKATNYCVCKYNTWFYGAPVSGSGYQWCAVFVCWVFNQAKALNLLGGSSKTASPMPSALRMYASCGYLAKAFKDKGRLIIPKSLTSGLSASQLKPGDVVFFHWGTEESELLPGTYVSDHTGIVEQINADGTITTIEGNTGDSANGAVMRRVRSMSVVSCAGRPAYSTAVSTKGKKGVDVSDWNGDIDMAKVKAAGYTFVMIKCGIGSDIKDQDDAQFENNVKKAEALGMPWGVYFYTYSLSAAQDQSELNHILRLLKGKKPTMPIALDVEDDGYKKEHGGWNYDNVNRNAEYLLDGLKKAGYYPILYTGYEELHGLISPDVYMRYDLWIAHWAKECWYKGSNLGIWQFGGETNVYPGETNSIPGVGVIDKDLCYKDYPKIIMDGGFNGWKPGSGGDTPVTPTYIVPDVVYRVRAGGRWYKEVDNLSSYAGKVGVPITDVAISVSRGRIKYRVHIKGGDWLPYVTGYDISESENGYAGDHKPIDAIEVYYYTPSDLYNELGHYLRAEYRVSPVGSSYYEWQFDDETSDGQDGYAGSFGKEIDRLQITLAK